MSKERNPVWVWIVTLLVGLPALVASLMVLSWGPACRLANHQVLPKRVITTLYRPVIAVYWFGPRPVRRFLRWSAGFTDGRITPLHVAFEDDGPLCNRDNWYYMFWWGP